MTPRTEPYQAVARTAAQLGFALIGVAPAIPTKRSEYIRDWLGAGRHGQMAYLADNIERRMDPRRLLPGARSVICIADRHPATTAPSSQDAQASGKIARYAWGNDYHEIIKKRLFALADALREVWPNEQYRAAVDTAPILEREHAVQAGLGWIGKHTLLIHPDLGSWLLLGQIVTTLAIEADDEPSQRAIPDHCGTCTRCIDACPTQCIEPYRLDASRCISYLTIEHRSLIDPELHEPMGDWIAGCDVCQEVCPFNRAEKRDNASFLGLLPDYAIRPPAPAIPLLDLLEWDREARQVALKRSALKRIKLDMFKRNALIAAGNYLNDHTDKILRQRIEEISEDRLEPEMVRATARQVMKRRGPDKGAKSEDMASG